MSEVVQSPVEGSQGSGIQSKQVSEEQGPNEQKLAKMVLNAYKDAKRFRSTYDKDWERWYRYYSGQHWDGPRPEWRSTPVVNFIFSTIETILPVMTDQDPEINIIAADPDSTQNADVISQIMKRVWVSNRMKTKLPSIVKCALKYGTGLAKVWWDPNMCKGKGDVAISVVDPRHFFPSPGATDIDNAQYVIFAANLPISTVIRQFPEAQGKLTGGIWDEDLTVNKNVTSQRTEANNFLGPVLNTAGTDTTTFKDQPTGRDGVMGREKLVTLIEMWHRDEMDNTMCTIMANGVLLKHGANPFAHNRFPFVKLVDYDIPSMFWGMGEIQQLEKLQDNINQRRAQITDILRLTANPPFVADADSGVNPKALTNRPASIIYKNRDSEVSWLTPPQLPNALFTLQEMDKQDFDSVSGVLDVTQGRKPAGIEAASAIAELQEAAQTRIRQKVRNMESFIVGIGELSVPLVQQFYDDERTIRLVGKSTGKPEFVTVNQMSLDPMSGQEIKINDVSIGEYDIEIGVGSTMPVNKTRRAEQMIELFQLGVVDRRAVLENVGLSPDEYERIITRMEQAEQQAMMMEAGMMPQEAQQMQATGESGMLPSEEELAALESGSASPDAVGLEASL